MFKKPLFDKQCGPRSDCSYRSSLIWVHAVCFYTKFISNVRQLFPADDFSRRHFQMHFFLCPLRVKGSIPQLYLEDMGHLSPPIQFLDRTLLGQIKLNTVNVLKITNTFVFLFSNKMLAFSAGIHKKLVRIPNREDPDQTASTEALGLHCLSRSF